MDLVRGASVTPIRGATDRGISVAPRFSINDVGHARRRPKRLAEKLLQIRKALGVSQRELIERLGVEMPYRNVSKYERDKAEPPIKVLLAYARAANVRLEQIVDDDQDLVVPHTPQM